MQEQCLRMSGNPSARHCAQHEDRCQFGGALLKASGVFPLKMGLHSDSSLSTSKGEGMDGRWPACHDPKISGTVDEVNPACRANITFREVHRDSSPRIMLSGDTFISSHLDSLVISSTVLTPIPRRTFRKRKTSLTNQEAKDIIEKSRMWLSIGTAEGWGMSSARPHKHQRHIVCRVLESLPEVSQTTLLPGGLHSTTITRGVASNLELAGPQANRPCPVYLHQCRTINSKSYH